MMYNEVQKISENFSICKIYRKTPPRPVVGLPMGTRFQETVTMDLTSCESWINFLSEESKIFKTSIFSKLCFPKSDNFKISNTDNICLSLSRTKWVRFNNKRRKFSELWSYTSKLKIIKIFFMKQYFFLNSNPDCGKILLHLIDHCTELYFNHYSEWKPWHYHQSHLLNLNLSLWISPNIFNR